MAKIIGAKVHQRRLKALPARTLEKVGRAIFVGAGQIETEARRLIVEGSIQGAGHIPSLPGEAPNRDTGQLDQSIVAQRTGVVTSETTANAPYAAFLELGTSKMEERPYMRPATRNKRPVIVELVNRAVRAAVGNS